MSGSWKRNRDRTASQASPSRRITAGTTRKTLQEAMNHCPGLILTPPLCKILQ